MEFHVLGSLELESDDGRPIPLTGPKRRALLALLVLHAGRVTAGEDLADELWGGHPPTSWTTTLQTFVGQLRQKFGVEWLLTTPSGYVLDAPAEHIDAACFEREVAEARGMARADPAHAFERLGRALGRWRGRAYDDVAHVPSAHVEAERLEAKRVDAIETWAACAIGAGRPAGVAAELETWVNRLPQRASLQSLHAAVLAAQGRATDERQDPMPAWTELARLDPSPHTAPGLTPPATRMRSPVARLHAAGHAPAPATDRFVGRSAELDALRHAFDAASRGEPQVVMVTGIAGIGKSRLLNEFTPGAVARGALLLWGSCQDDAPVPYLALATAFDALGEENPFVSFETAGAGLDDGARLALYVSATRAVLDEARERLVLLVVEDVHAADEATLGLLRHLLAVGSENAARERSQLMIVVTTRRADPGSTVDLISFRLRNAAKSQVIDLPPLDAHSTRELAADWLDHRPSPPTVDRLVTAAGGNPLVLRSVLDRMRTQGSDEALALGPTDLDHELWHRLDGMEPGCRTMLLQAALLGDGARLQWLACTLGVDDVALDALVDTAAAHRALVADDERYWFDHPQLRQLVYHSAHAHDRAVLHGQAADRLGTLGVDPMVVAHHLAAAGLHADPAVVLDVCREAADRAAAMGAWHDALKHALVALDAAPPTADATLLADLHLRVGRAAFLARDRDVAVHHLSRAVELAEACGALATWGAAAVHLARESVDDREQYASTQLALGGVERFLAAAGDELPALRAEAHAIEAEVYSDRDLETALEHARRAEQLAAEVEDDDVLAKVRFANGVRHLIAVDFDDARTCFRDARARAVRLADPNPALWCAGRLGLRSFATGELDEAEHWLARCSDDAHDADNLGELSMAAAVAASVAAMRGRYAQCEEEGARARAAYRYADYWFTPGIVFPTVAAARAVRGDLAGAHESLDDWDRVHDRASRRYRPVVEGLAGTAEGAESAYAAHRFRVLTGDRADLITSGALAAQGALGGLLGARDLAAGAVEPLAYLYDRGLRFSVGWPQHIGHVLGLASEALDEPRDADRWFEHALDDARRRRADGALARIARDYGKILASRGDEAAGDELFALATRTAAGSVGAAAHPTSPGSAQSAIRVMVVTDLVESTDLNSRVGDQEYLALLREHDRIVRERLARHDGVEFKHTGDGIAAWFFSPGGALECAAAVCDEFERRFARSAAPLRVKVALSAGEPTPIEGDLIGLSVTAAFRALGHAGPGEVLATTEVVGLARGLPWRFASRGQVPLKGFAGPVELFTVSR